MEDALRAHPLWKNDSADAWEDTVEALERFVISKIYDKVVSDVDFWLWAVGCGTWDVGCRLWDVGCGMCVRGCRVCQGLWFVDKGCAVW